MKRAPLDAPNDNPADGVPPGDDEVTGLPGFRTWRRVYLFVFGCFVLAVVFLALFSRHFA
ncbi:MAG: hypothetical protein IPL39_22450 [Opitutaceae bacterium]|nr:hypothetical protein [Opitutaceae bacterium]